MKSKLTINKFGDKEWVLPNSSLHREDGPAVERSDGYRAWYMNNVNYTERQYKYEMRSRKLTELLK